MRRGAAGLVIVLLFLSALGVRLYELDSESIWMDEDMQAGRANRNPFDPTLVDRAALQQQPPIDYVFQAIALKNFRLSTVGARIGAVFLGTLTVMGLMLIAMTLSKERLIWAAGFAIALIHPGLVRFSQEGRPVAMAVLLATIHLLIILKTLARPALITQLDWFLGLVITEIALLWSIGFQPVVFLLTSAVALLPFLLIREQRRTVGIVYLATGLALLIASPILLNTVAHSQNYVPEKSLLLMFGRIFDGLFELTLDGVLERYATTLQQGIIPILLIVAAGVITMIVKRRTFQNRSVFTSAIYLVLFSALFPLLFDTLFTALIDYRITERYYLVFVPVLLSLFVAMLEIVVNAIKSHRTFPSRPGLILVALIVVFVFSSFSYQTVSGIYHEKTNAGWREMYQLFRQPGHEGSRAYMMNLIRLNRYRPYFFARRFYYSSKTPPVALSRIDQLPKHYKSNKVWRRCPKLFFATMYGYNNIRADLFEELPFVTVRRFGHLSVMSITPASSMHNSVLKLFRHMSERLGASEVRKKYFYKIHETLFELERIEENPEGMKNALKRLESINQGRHLSPLIRKLSKRLKK